MSKLPAGKLPAAPWSSFTQDSFHGWWAVQDFDGKEIGSGDGGFSYEEAMMLAAGPSLLAAMKEMLLVWEKLCILSGWNTSNVIPYIKAKKLVNLIEEECGYVENNQ